MPKRKRKVLPKDETIVLDTAYQELSRDGFAVWVRMHLIPSVTLEQAGIMVLSSTFKYSESGFQSVLKELQACGYISLKSGKPGEITKIRLIRKALLIGTNHFIKL